MAFNPSFSGRPKVLSSLGMKVNMMIVIAMTIAVVCLGVYDYRNERAEEIARLKEGQAETVSRLQIALATPLWNLNTDEIEPIVLAEMASDDIVAIEVHDKASDKFVAQFGRDEAWQVKHHSALPPADQIFSSSVGMIQREDVEIGQVRVFMTDQFALMAARSRLGGFLLKIGVLLVTVVLCLMAIIRHLVARPIALLNDAVANIDVADAVKLLDTQRKDELGRLASTFASMQTRIESLFAERDGKITELEHAEQKFEMELRMRTALLDNIPGCIAMILKKDTREIVASNKLARESGAIPGRTCFKTCAMRDDPCPFCQAPNMWAKDQLQKCEVKHGGIWYEGIWAPLSEDVYVHYIFDISERKRTEQALRDTEKLNRSVLESSPVCTKIIDLDFTLRYMSTAGVKMLKLDDIEPYYGKPYPLEFYPEPMRIRLLEGLKLAMAGEISSVETPINDIEGNEVWFHTTYVPVFDDDGHVEYVIGSSIDITEQKQAEEQRLSLERQLHQAQKMEAIGQLAGGVAHDFNNLLTAIMGNAELLSMALSAESKEADYANHILTASSRASDLTKQLLAFSRKGKTQTKTVDLHQIITEVHSLLAHSIDKRIKIVEQLEAISPVVNGDPSQLQSAVLNLALNSRDAMPEGGQLTFSTRSVQLDGDYGKEYGDDLPAGEYLDLAVTDTGVGIDEEVLNRLFEPFYTTKKHGEGTGLGLASVYGCVQNHSGTIHVESTKGQGSTFRMLLPLASKLQSTAEPDSTSSQLVHGIGSIMVIDDEETVRELATDALTHLGYNVSAFSNGTSALAYFGQHHTEIDLVILDLIMPNLGGKEVLSQLQHIDPNVRVLIASGFTKDLSVDALIDQGALGFLQKPYSIKSLSQEVARHLPVPSKNLTSQ